MKRLAKIVGVVAGALVLPPLIGPFLFSLSRINWEHRE